jgi:membrane-associated phospholipid phosphatase
VLSNSKNFLKSLVLVSEVFYAAYFSYYLMITGVGVALFVSRRSAFYHYMSVVSFVCYVCYVIYTFVPVMGPRVFYRPLSAPWLPVDILPAAVPAFPTAVQAGPFYQLMAWIYRTFETPGAAFPSSHVAVAIVTAYFSCRYLPRIRRVHLVLVLLLCLSTIYCRYHYVVDCLAGTLLAWALIPLGNALYFTCEKAPPQHRELAFVTHTEVSTPSCMKHPGTQRIKVPEPP